MTQSAEIQAEAPEREEPAGAIRPTAPGSHGSRIMPQSTTASRTLIMVMAVMCYLACLALGSVIVITNAVNTWTSDISSQITIQIKPVDGRRMENEIRQTLAILRETPGVKDAIVLSDEDTADLLEPWLGQGEILAELPVPRIITVGIDPRNPPDTVALDAALKDKVPGATVDTHRQWQAHLTRTAGTLRLIGYGVLILISVTTVAIVIFATRSALAANRDIVEVLHLVGAYDNFIAIQVQWHFLQLGLKAGLIGGAAGVATFIALGLYASGQFSGGFPQGFAALVSGPAGISVTGYLLFLLVPAFATLISVLTARMAVLRILSSVL